MPYKTFSIEQALLNLIFLIIVPAAECTLKPINCCIRTWFQIFPQLTKKAQEWVYSYQSGFYCYLPSGVATRRATTISTNMSLPSLKSVCKLTYFPINLFAGIRAVRFMKYGLFLQEFLQQFSKFILKKIFTFFKKQKKQNTFSKIVAVNEYLKMKSFIVKRVAANLRLFIIET